MRRDNVWTTRELQLLQENYMDHTDRELATIIGTRTVSAIKACRAKLGLTRGHKLAGDRRRGQALFTPDQYSFFLEHNHEKSAADLAEMINDKFGTTFTAQQIMNFRKNQRHPCGRDTRFRKGVVSWAAGRKIEEYMSPESLERFRRNQFRSGHCPHNTDPIGTVKPKCNGYLWIKISDRKNAAGRENWKPYHHYLWEREHGPVPDGKRLIFLDGNLQNCDPGNLALVSVEEAGMLQGIRSSDPEVTRTGVMIARIRSRTRRLMDGKK